MHARREIVKEFCGSNSALGPFQCFALGNGEGEFHAGFGDRYLALASICGVKVGNRVGEPTILTSKNQNTTVSDRSFELELAELPHLGVFVDRQGQLPGFVGCNVSASSPIYSLTL